MLDEEQHRKIQDKKESGPSPADHSPDKYHEYQKRRRISVTNRLTEALKLYDPRWGEKERRNEKMKQRRLSLKVPPPGPLTYSPIKLKASKPATF